MNDDRRSPAANPRRRRPLMGALVSIVALASVPVVLGLFGGGDPAGPKGTPTGPSADTGPPPVLGPTIDGRLAYLSRDPGHPDRRRLWVLDLETGSLVEGTTFRGVDELHAAGPVNSWLVLIATDGADRVGYLVRDPSTPGLSIEVARGDLVSISTDGNSLLIARTRSNPPGPCTDTSYELRRTVLASFNERTAFRGRLACGTLVAATLLGSRVPLISLLHRGQTQVHRLRPGDPQVLFRGLTHVAASASGSLLLVDDRTGELRFWPGGGTPRAVVIGSRVLPERMLAWSGEGRYLLLEGLVGDERGTWLIDTAAGTAERFPPPGYPLAGELVGAAFADDGTLYVAAPGRIVAFTASAVFPISLPPGVPSPIGPVAWLP